MSTAPQATRGTARATYLAMLLVSSGAMVLFPLFPALQVQLHIPTASLGLVAAAGFATTLVAVLAVAPQADRGHGRLMATGGVVLLAVSLAASALSTTAWELIAARGIGGFGVGLFSAAASALLIRSEPTRSGELLGKLGGAELAGISIGPLAGALALSVTNPQVIFGVSAVVVALGAIATFVWMREVVEVAEPTERPPAVSFDLLRSRFVIGAVLLQVAIMFPTGVYDAIWPRFMADIGSTNLLTAASYTLFAIPYVILAGWAGRLADRLGGAQAFTRGIIIVIVTMPLYALIPNPWAANGLGFLESTGQALAFGGAAAAMAHIVDPARAASGQGLGRAAGLVAATVASGFTGLVYATGGSLIVFAGSAVVVAVISIVALVLLRGARARRNAANSPMTQLPFVP